MKYTDEQILAWLDGDLDDELSAAIAAWIESSGEARQRVAELQSLEQLFNESLEYEPPAEMFYSFKEQIALERERSANRIRWFQAAAAVVLLIGGFGIGSLMPGKNSTSTEIGDLKNEVQVLQQMVLLNTLRNHTASERLKVINTIESTKTPSDTDLIGTLVHTMNYDESPNVRVAAVEALGRYIDQEGVRAEMVHSLGEQDNAMVQITMINLLMKAEEKSAIAPIRKIARNDDSPPEVRQTAEIALDILKQPTRTSKSVEKSI